MRLNLNASRIRSSELNCCLLGAVRLFGEASVVAWAADLALPAFGCSGNSAAGHNGGALLRVCARLVGCIGGGALRAAFTLKRHTALSFAQRLMRHRLDITHFPSKNDIHFCRKCSGVVHDGGAIYGCAPTERHADSAVLASSTASPPPQTMDSRAWASGAILLAKNRAMAMRLA